MKYIIIFLAIIFLLPLVNADSTFFDNPDDFFVMSSSTTPTTGQVTGGGGCRYEWNCTDWSECLPSGKQTRNCTNIGTCSDRYKTPELGQNCTYTAPKVEEEKDKDEEEPSFAPEEEKERESEEISINWNYILFIAIVALFCAGCIGIFKYRKSIRNLISGLNKVYDDNSIKGLINKKVYTDEGYYIGRIEEAILQRSKIHSLKVRLDKRHKFVAKGVIIKYRNVKALQKIVIVDDAILSHLRKYKN